MSNKLPKDEVILKCTKVYKKKIDETTAICIKNEFDGTTFDCLLSLASAAVDLEFQQPEEDRARFRSDLLEYMNKMRCRQVIN